MARHRVHPIVNTLLADAIARNGLSLARVAAAVNDVGAENGLGLSYDATAVSHWQTGTVPRPEAVATAVEAFTRIEGRRLAAADLGWPEPPHDRLGDPWRGDPVTELTALGRGDMLDRRSALTTGLYSLAAITLPVQPEQIARRGGPSRRGGPGDVDRIQEMTRRLSDADDLYGGGHARAAVAAYLMHEVTPLLRGTTGRARPALFQAASRLAYLAGYMASDAGSAGLAQRYYIQAARLADEGGAPIMHATVLRSLAVQALELGHGREGLALADHAAAMAGGNCPLRTRAWITGMQAEANAATGSRWEALAGLRLAERELERADSLPETEWTGRYRQESLKHQTGQALVSLRDYVTAERQLAASAASRRPVERRTRLLVSARLAHVQVRLGRAEEAASTVLGLAGDLPAVSSARVVRELAAVRRRWQPQRSNAAVNEADAVLAAALRP